MPEDEARRRGRPARVEPARATGYRCTDPVRRQLTIASAFLDEPNMQAVIDRAVKNFLAQLRDDRAGFAEAVIAAERSATGNPGNVTNIHGRRG